MKEKIIIVEDDPAMRLGMNHFLRAYGYEATSCDDGAKALSILDSEIFDIAIVDLKLPGVDGLTLLKHIKTISPQTGVIIITAFAEVKTAVQAIKDGAFDYIAKPFTNEELLLVIERFLKFRTLEKEVKYLSELVKKKDEFEGIVSTSSVMKEIFDKIDAVAKTDVPVLIQGESGTGKELIANAIQKQSLRKEKPYIKINCAAIPETLFESELFGYEKGAFTGATETKKGKFELANGGTIFFDEIGDMPLSLQAKLLRVIEDGIVYRLGGKEPIKINVRCIYATSKNLKELIKAEKFREDLFYRINVMPIAIPPLKERKEDIPVLIEKFLKIFSEKYGKQNITISPSAYEALLSYDYPGNVRELKHAIERALLLSKDGVIDIKHLPEEFSPLSSFQKKCFISNFSLKECIENFEKNLIIKALQECGWKKTEAAKKLGISRKALWEKIKFYGIEPNP
ncbi:MULTISPECIES: sigma-54-dependent transcriptional regulator [Thermodesulfovibrio]|jgi:DNA-binding NtrC family response regulator|uniref:Acetoacetate metabolism regulatory protein AtoC n=2 Tax=Thermodesulfovibrio yellowstonii TaxID=28262 RepID=B5YHF3_THEYD|nr:MULTISPECIES: sigma-54 dependent transcriptional regulator [Thermodesulfovibrio]ACI21996.1 acetoacetate metabolism regulatory protein AtoC [Thermodesulfovibrio yellowstonii DSM 11347]GLI52659.1 sigma-54-dependent Fis family transcriptional regulator [Thermodesulfovibrio islandicus]